VDIMCPVCGEPWDHDTLHEAADEQETSYADVARRFRSEGCAAIGWSKCSNTSASPAIAAVYDILGDDMDGAAAMLEDAAYFGELA
jgi:hypothetical protein